MKLLLTVDFHRINSDGKGGEALSQKHLGTVHAIAMCNAAELVARVMTDASTPDTHRWIPTGMTVRYLINAKTDFRAVSKGDGLDLKSEGDIDVPVSIYDTDDREVFTAVITMKVSLKK